MKQAVSVIKKRSGNHERTIREMRIGKEGITLGEPLRELQGVLSGVPTFCEWRTAADHAFIEMEARATGPAPSTRAAAARRAADPDPRAHPSNDARLTARFSGEGGFRRDDLPGPG